MGQSKAHPNFVGDCWILSSQLLVKHNCTTNNFSFVQKCSLLRCPKFGWCYLFLLSEKRTFELRTKLTTAILLWLVGSILRRSISQIWLTALFNSFLGQSLAEWDNLTSQLLNFYYFLSTLPFWKSACLPLDECFLFSWPLTHLGRCQLLIYACAASALLVRHYH